ncbi:endonuclease domain-containing protein [Frankia tisae]|nr:endonuclease domain-containing protein [Frankia tisae]
MATGRWGIALRRDWFDLVDGRAESPLESRLRLLLADADLPPPEVQWPVWDGDGAHPRPEDGSEGPVGPAESTESAGSSSSESAGSVTGQRGRRTAAAGAWSPVPGPPVSGSPVPGPPVSGSPVPGPLVSGPTAFRRGRLLARVDLAWPEARVAVEADGAAVHSQPDALFRDRIRQNALLARGWRVLRFTWEDVVMRSAYVVATVSRLLAATPG